MHVRVFGEIGVEGDERIALGGPTQQRVLAALALHRGEVVSVSHLVEVVWPDREPPARAEHNVRTYVHRLRASLAGDGERIETVGAGYRLRLDVDELDAAQFEQLADVATRLAATGDTIHTLERISQAEGLWRGGPLNGFEDEPWAVPTVVRLREKRANLRERRAAALIDVGRPLDAIEGLEELLHDEPLRERPRALLMRGLYESGRQAEALRAFQEFRALLVDEIGVEPSNELAALDRSIALGNLPVAALQPRRAGAYELHERIGEGAFAVVYRATQPSLGREVAVKIVRAELANEPEFIRRFEAEAQMVARIEHPNVVPLYDYWREPDRAFLALRWMTGGSLTARLGDGPWAIEDTVVLVDQIAAALGAAHRQGVVHRDVKPENILFDAEGRAYLGDFGIALDAEQRSGPASAQSDGSPVFASPEQLRCEPLGPEADIHALAIVAYVLLMGHAPFADAPDEAALLQRQLHEPIPPTRTSRPDLPERIDEVLAIATAKQPSDRYPTAEAFALALRGAASGTTVATSAHARVGPRTNPFKGLDSFTEADAADFHGRDRLVGELVTRMGDPEVRLLAVVGPSGSGKSSVVRAGLIPAVRKGRVTGSSRWFISTMIPGSHPFEALETALLRIAVNPPSSLLDQLRDGPRGVLRSVRRVLPDDDGVLLLVVDQFEELFTSSVDEADRDLFLRALTVAVTEPATPVRVIVTLRADFFDRPLRHPEFAPLIKRDTVAIAPLAPDELERAIVDPAASVGVGFEAGLVAEIVADVNSHPGALPLMQYALTRAFDSSDGVTITVNDYRSIGGLTGALAQQAEEIWQDASPTEQSATRRLFGRLVTLGEGREDTRRRVLRAELDAEPATEAMVDRYGKARLLSFDRDATTREPTLEVAHEAVLREWPRLREWLDEDRDRLRIHRHLTTTAAGWVESERDPSELYRGPRLAAAESLIGDDTIALNAVEAEYLATSVETRAELESKEHRRVRRRRYVTVAIALIAVLAIAASVVAVWQRDRADTEATAAERSAALAADNASLAEQRARESDSAREDAEAAGARADSAAVQAGEDRDAAEDARVAADLQRLEAQAVALSDRDVGLGALLALEAGRISGSVSSRDALHRVLTNTDGVVARIPGAYGPSRISADGNTLIAFGVQHLDVWDLRTLTLVRRVERPYAWSEFDVTADASLVAFTDAQGTYVLDVATGASKKFLDEATPALAFSSDGQELAVARDGALQFWGVATPLSPELVEERPTAEGVIHIAWNPIDDGYAVVMGTTVEYWHRRDLARTWSYKPRIGVHGWPGFTSTLYSTDGASLVVANGELRGGSGIMIRTYSTADGPIEGSEFPSPSVLFELDWADEARGYVTATTLPNAALLAFDLTQGSVIDPPFEGLGVWSIGYSPALDREVTSGAFGIEIRHPLRAGPLERIVQLTDEQRDSAVRSGLMYASLTADNAGLIVAVWEPSLDPDSTEEIQGDTVIFDLTSEPVTNETVQYHALPVGAGPYTLMINLEDARVLDADLQPLGEPIATPSSSRVFHPSPDGRFFAIWRADGVVDLYRSTGERVAELKVPFAEPEYEGINFSFSADGSRLVGHLGIGGGGPSNGRWAIWDTETGAEIDEGGPEVLRKPIIAGDTLFAARSADDLTLLQLDPATYEPVGPPLVGPTQSISSIVDDGSGVLVAAADFQGVVRVFDKASGTQLGREITGANGFYLQFSTDGTTLMTIMRDHISLWNYDTTTWSDIACRLAGRNLTRAEWEEFGPRTIGYRATCPQFPIDE